MAPTYATIPTTPDADEESLLVNAAKTKKPLLRLAGAALVVAFALGATVAYVAPSKSGLPSATAVAAFKSNSRQCVSIADGINDKQCPTNCDEDTECDWCDTLYQVKGNVEGTFECGGSGPRDRFLDVECHGVGSCRGETSGVDLRVPDFDLKLSCKDISACGEGVVSTGGDLNLDCDDHACHYTHFTSTGPLVAECIGSYACRGHASMEATFSSETSIDITCKGRHACAFATLRAPQVTLTCGNDVYNEVCEGIRIPDSTICTCTGNACPPECPAKESRVPMMALDAVSPAGADAATAVAAKSATYVEEELLCVPDSVGGCTELIHRGSGPTQQDPWDQCSKYNAPPTNQYPCWLPMPMLDQREPCQKFCLDLVAKYPASPCYVACVQNCGRTEGPIESNPLVQPDCNFDPQRPGRCKGKKTTFYHQTRWNGLVDCSVGMDDVTWTPF